MILEETPNIEHPNVRKLKQIAPGRIFIASDIHGHWRECLEILERQDFHEWRDALIIAGDGVDRGPESKKVIGAFAIAQYIMGNHEFNQMLYPHGQMTNWPGTEWFQDLPEGVKRSLASLYEQLPLAIELELLDGRKVGICHTFSNTFRTWKAYKDATNHLGTMYHELLFDRLRLATQNREVIPDISYIICGHTSVSEPYSLGNVNFIDTGSGKGGRVTILEVDNLDKRYVRPGMPTYIYEGK